MPTVSERGLDQVNRSRKFVLRWQSFYATLMQSLTMKEIPKGTMATDAVNLYWCAEFIVTHCNQLKTTFILLHEILHVVLKHCFRFIDPVTKVRRDPTMWNTACDHVVNALIVRMGLKFKFTDDQFRRLTRRYLISDAEVLREEYRLPDDAVLDPKFWGLTAEEVYDVLKKEADQQQPQPDDNQDADKGDDQDDQQPGQGSDDQAAEDQAAADAATEDHWSDGMAEEGGPEEGQGDGKGTPKGDCPWGNFEEATGEDGEPLSDDQIEDICHELDRLVATAENVAKGRGQMPVDLSNAINKANEPSQDWADILQALMVDHIPVDVSFKKPNRYYSTADHFAPSEECEGIGHVGIFSDASGSVTASEFSQFMGDWDDICQTLQPELMTMIQFDSYAGEPEEIERGDEPEFVRRHNGGTDFRAPFRKAEELGILDDMDVIVIFTDGGDDRYYPEPDCPVIWATTAPFYGGNPPYGEVVRVKFNR